MQRNDDRISGPDKVLGGFDAFIDRKSRAAAAAVLPPFTTEFERPLDGMIAIGSAWTTRLFDGPFYLSPLPERLPACHLAFTRNGSGRTDYRVLDTRGTLHVVRQPSPWSLTAGVGERIRDVIESLLPGH